MEINKHNCRPAIVISNCIMFTTTYFIMLKIYYKIDDNFIAVKVIVITVAMNVFKKYFCLFCQRPCGITYFRKRIRNTKCLSKYYKNINVTFFMICLSNLYKIKFYR